MLRFRFSGILSAPAVQTLCGLLPGDPEGQDHFRHVLRLDIVLPDQSTAAEGAVRHGFALIKNDLRPAAGAGRTHQTVALRALPDLFLLQLPEALFFRHRFPELYGASAEPALIRPPDDIVLCRRTALGAVDIRNTASVSHPDLLLFFVLHLLLLYQISRLTEQVFHCTENRKPSSELPVFMF